MSRILVAIHSSLSKEELKRFELKIFDSEKNKLRAINNIHWLFRFNKVKAKRILRHSPVITYKLTKLLRKELFLSNLTPKMFILLAVAEVKNGLFAIDKLINFLKVSNELGIPLNLALSKFMKGREQVLIHYLIQNEKKHTKDYCYQPL